MLQHVRHDLGAGEAEVAQQGPALPLAQPGERDDVGGTVAYPCRDADSRWDVDIDVADGRAQLSIVCEDEDDSNLRTLVGRDGKTLGALQELVRLAVQTSTGQRSWLMLDIDGYRSSRRDELIRKAEDAIAEVKESGEEFAFKAMNSFERKIIHDQVAKAGLVSESEGEGDGRHVVVRPADD